MGMLKCNMLTINLLTKYYANLVLTAKIGEMIDQLKLNKSNTKFKVYDVIEFVGGFNNDILYTSKIMGFDNEGGIYVWWDCYWFPIKDDEVRQIELVK